MEDNFEPKNIETTPPSAPLSTLSQEDLSSQLERDHYIIHLKTLDNEKLTKELDDTPSRIWVENTCIYLISIGRFNGALDILNDFLFKIMPSASTYLKLRATCYFELKRYRLALNDLNKIEPSEHTLLTLKQRIFIYAQKLETLNNALTDIDTALTHIPATINDHEIIISCLEEKLNLLKVTAKPTTELELTLNTKKTELAALKTTSLIVSIESKPSIHPDKMIAKQNVTPSAGASNSRINMEQQTSVLFRRTRSLNAIEPLKREEADFKRPRNT